MAKSVTNLLLGRLVLAGQWHEDGKRKDWIADARFDIDQNASTMAQARLQTADSIERGEVNAELYINTYRPARTFKVRFIVTAADAKLSEE